MKVILLFFILISCLTSCKSNIDVEYLKSTDWIYNDGYRVTDFFTFDKSGYYSIKCDTILVDGKPRALIIDLNKKGHDLTIKSLDGKKIGHYMDEREMEN